MRALITDHHQRCIGCGSDPKVQSRPEPLHEDLNRHRPVYHQLAVDMTPDLRAELRHEIVIGAIIARSSTVRADLNHEITGDVSTKCK